MLVYLKRVLFTILINSVTLLFETNVIRGEITKKVQTQTHLLEMKTLKLDLSFSGKLVKVFSIKLSIVVLVLAKAVKVKSLIPMISLPGLIIVKHFPWFLKKL